MDLCGHVLPYVKFAGGSLTLSEHALLVLEQLANRQDK